MIIMTRPLLPVIDGICWRVSRKRRLFPFSLFGSNYHNNNNNGTIFIASDRWDLLESIEETKMFTMSNSDSIAAKNLLFKNL